MKTFKRLVILALLLATIMVVVIAPAKRMETQKVEADTKGAAASAKAALKDAAHEGAAAITNVAAKVGATTTDTVGAVKAKINNATH